MGKKNKGNGVVFSTNPNFSFENEEENDQETLAPNQQKLYVSIDRKQRGGKEVTLVEGFIGLEEYCKELGKILKSTCGVGGSVKDFDILVQGKVKDKVFD